MDIQTYLKRIDYSGDLTPNFENLTQIHLAHLHAVPFENLDIALEHRFEVSREASYQKVVTERRGGFCYEVNGLFHWLLEELGYEVSLLSARTFDGTEFGLPSAHMLILVEFPHQQVIADVAFGESFREPLILNSMVQTQLSGSYQLLEKDDGHTLVQLDGEAEPEVIFTFSLKKHELSDFEPMCEYQQTSEDSIFTQKSVCTLATPTGRTTIANGRLIVTKFEDRSKSKTLIMSESAYRQLLQEHFGLSLSPSLKLDRLLAS